MIKMGCLFMEKIQATANAEGRVYHAWPYSIKKAMAAEVAIALLGGGTLLAGSGL
jgi:hypothetical protein